VKKDKLGFMKTYTFPEMNEIDTTKKMIKFLKKGYGTKRCKETFWGCPNCFGQLLIDFLEYHLMLLEEE